MADHFASGGCALELAISMDESLSGPLYRQLYDGLREAILSGRLSPGSRLPSSRAFARRLSVSRTTVAQAYAELESEGYLRGRRGSGTFVSDDLPEDRASWSEILPAGQGQLAPGVRPAAEPSPASVAQPAPDVEVPQLVCDFHPGQGAWDAFPRELWRKLLARQWRASWRDTMDYGDPAGYRELRIQVAGYLARSRAVRCGVDQVVIVNGTQQALDILSRVLLERGARVAVENPGYLAARKVFTSYAAEIVPVPVDSQGLVVDELRGTEARLALVTPSHQFPTGATLPLSRRLALLSWARSRGSLIVEDDYDSEFRFEGRPIPSLQGLDEKASVAYLGSFSKVLFPALRVGYAVLPRDLVGPFVEAKELTDRQTPILEQRVLADFLAEGHFERHLRRMRELYRVRRRALEEALRQELGNSYAIIGSSAGMHLMLRLPEGSDADAVVERATRLGLGLHSGSPYCVGEPTAQSLLLGYAGLSEDRIREGVALLRCAITG